MEEEASSPQSEGILRSFDRLLTEPKSLLQGEEGRSSVPFWLLAGSLIGFVVYGGGAGSFQGGNQILVTALKAPLIVAMALALCLPSLYVFGALSGARWSKRRLLAMVSGFTATLGLLLAALVPISWLFSVSSRYLASAVWIHIMLWLISLAFGWRFLGSALRESGAGGGMFLWLVLFILVSFQVATFLRPVLWRDAGDPFFERGKMSFVEHFGDVFDHDYAAEKAAEAKAKAQEAEQAEKAKKKSAKPDQPRS